MIREGGLLLRTLLPTTLVLPSDPFPGLTVPKGGVLPVLWALFLASGKLVVGMFWGNWVHMGVSSWWSVPGP